MVSHLSSEPNLRSSPSEVVAYYCHVQSRVTKRQPALVERLNALRWAEESERVAIAIYMYGLQSWKELDLCRDAAVDLKRARQLIEDLLRQEPLLRFPSSRVAHFGSTTKC